MANTYADGFYVVTWSMNHEQFQRVCDAVNRSDDSSILISHLVPQKSIIEVYNNGKSARDMSGFVYDMAEVRHRMGSMAVLSALTRIAKACPRAALDVPDA